jgi:hypothetical protein
VTAHKAGGGAADLWVSAEIAWVSAEIALNAPVLLGNAITGYNAF